MDDREDLINGMKFFYTMDYGSDEF